MDFHGPDLQVADYRNTPRIPVFAIEYTYFINRSLYVKLCQTDLSN